MALFQRKYLLAVGLVAALLLAWTGVWFWLANRAVATLDDYAASRRAEQVEFAWDSITVSGFPIRLLATIANPRGQWRAPQRTITWSGADTVLRFLTDGPRVLRFDAPGSHALRIADATGEVELETRHAQLQGRIAASEHGPAEQVQLASRDMHLLVNGAMQATFGSIEGDWVRRHHRSDPDAIDPSSTGQDLAITMTGIDLTAMSLDPAVRNILGNEVARLDTRISLRGDIRPRTIDSATLARWRDAGGTIELESLDIEWGPVRLRGDGTFALDGALQPIVALSARIAGLDRVIDVLEGTGQVRPQQAAIARIMLAVFTRAPANGGPPEAQVPISIQDGRLSIGPVPLVRIPPIVWD
jgi:hypothetical protein